jgi:hypothetical protein
MQSRNELRSPQSSSQILVKNCLKKESIQLGFSIRNAYHSRFLRSVQVYGLRKEPITLLCGVGVSQFCKVKFFWSASVSLASETLALCNTKLRCALRSDVERPYKKFGVDSLIATENQRILRSHLAVTIQALSLRGF